jgi:hypothetical protein
MTLVVSVRVRQGALVKGIVRPYNTFAFMKKNKCRFTYTEDQLAEAVKESLSYAEVLRRLGLKPAGGNHAAIKRRITEFEFDTSHFKGQGWNRGQNFGPRRDIHEYLVDISNGHGPNAGSHKLRLRLFREGIKEAKCECCGITKWNGFPAPLELDHINGNHFDNRLENLRILCPNCHAQTPTYRGKNKRKKKEPKPAFDHNRLSQEMIDYRLNLISFIDLTKFGWVNKVAECLGVSHTQARRFVNKYYSGKIYTRE